MSQKKNMSCVNCQKIASLREEGTNKHFCGLSCQMIYNEKFGLHQYLIEHVDYTYWVIYSILKAPELTKAHLDRLMRNQEDIGGSNTKIVKLLKEHIEIAGRIVVAVKDKKPTNDLINEWRLNGDELGDVFNLTGGEFQTHLTQTINYTLAMAHLNPNWSDVIEKVDIARNHMASLINKL